MANKPPRRRKWFNKGPGNLLLLIYYSKLNVEENKF